MKQARFTLAPDNDFFAGALGFTAPKSAFTRAKNLLVRRSLLAKTERYLVDQGPAS